MTAALLDWPQVCYNLNTSRIASDIWFWPINLTHKCHWIITASIFSVVPNKCAVTVLVSGYSPVHAVLSRLVETGFSR